MTTEIDVEYDCCNAKYTFYTTLKDDELLLHNPALGDTLILQADHAHALEHPDCP